MAGMNQPIIPAGTLTLAVSTASATGTLPTGGDAVLVFNASSAVVFVRLDNVAASATDTPVPPGARMLMSCPSTVTQASALAASGSGSVYFTRCVGSTY